MEEFVKLNIDKIPYNCDYNKNNKKTIILLSGFGGDYKDWNDTKPLDFFKSYILKDWKDGKQYEHLIKKGKLNFQKTLAMKNYNVLSYTPFEYINMIIEEQNKKYQLIKPNKYFYNIEQMCFTLKTLLSKLKLHPPYIFVGFSEGGWRALLFAEYFKNNVEKCVLIDPQRFQKTTIENTITYNAYKLLTKDTLKTVEDNCVFYKYKNLISKYKIPKENKTKIIIYLNVLPKSIICDTEFVNKINKSFANTQWNIYLDQIHALHFLYFDNIINSIIHL